MHYNWAAIGCVQTATDYYLTHSLITETMETCDVLSDSCMHFMSIVNFANAAPLPDPTLVPDKRVMNWPLMHSPIPIAIILSIYLAFVKIWGPAYMKNRKAYNLRKVLLAYNALQVLACVYIVIKTTPLVYRLNWRCNPIDYTEPASVPWNGYILLLLKLVDLADTVFFILRKKQKQVTFLHVYHHCTMVLCMWVGTKYYAGGHSSFIPYINCVVHVVMYSYYLLTAFDEKHKQSLWWKKHITQLQLFQFLLLMVLFLLSWFTEDCDYPTHLIILTVILNTTMFVLFSNFYYHAYIKKTKTV